MNTKLCSTEVKSLGDRKVSFTISTAAVDRDGDTIDPKGWKLDNYLRSPVVLWAHDYSQPPIGKASNLWTDAKGLHATVEFTPMGMYPFADMIHDMCKGGFLNATSVGFRGEGVKAKDREHGYHFTQAELLEFSIVSVPSNPHALVTQRSVNRSAVLKWLGQDNKVNLDAIFESKEREIDWHSINLQLSSRPKEVDVTAEDVHRVINRMMPVFRERIRAALKVQAQLAVASAFRHMTGRLD